MDFRTTYSWLIELGYSPMPIIPNTKKPVQPEWQKLCVERATDKLMSSDRWKTQTQSVGLCMGKEFGECIDIDVDDEELIKWATSQYEFPAKRGAKGITLFCRLPDSIRTKINDDGLDILTGNAYTVIAPSVHPVTRKPYEWALVSEERLAKGATPLPPVSELPVVSEEFINELRGRVEKLVAKSIRSGQPIGGIEGRDNELTCYSYGQARTMIENTGHCDPETLATLILNHDLTAHAGHRDGPWYSDPSEKGKENPRKHAVARASRAIARALRDGAAYIKPTEITLEAPIEVDEALRAELEQALVRARVVPSADEISSQAAALVPDTPAFNALKKRLRILSGQEADPALLLATAAAIGVALAQNRFCVNGVTWPALYLYCLAQSGFGKSFYQRTISEILLTVQSCPEIDTETRNIIGYSEYGSRVGVLGDAWDERKQVMGRRSRLDIMDEISHTLLGDMVGKDVPQYKAGLMQQLCKLFSAPGTVMGGAALREGKNAPMLHLAISFIGFTVPENAKMFADPRFHSSGLAARGLYFFARRKTEHVQVFAPGSRNARALVGADDGRAWVSELIDFIKSNPIKAQAGSITGISGGLPLDPIEMVPREDEELAKLLDDEFNLSMAAAARAALAEDDRACARLARRYELAVRLAISRACLECRTFITKEDVQWGIDVWAFSGQCIEWGIAYAEGREEREMLVSEQDQQSMHSAIVDYMRALKSKGTVVGRVQKGNMKRVLCQRLRCFPQVFEEAWTHLISGGILAAAVSPSGGNKPITTFEIVPKNEYRSREQRGHEKAYFRTSHENE
jgi:hypothetical protein